MCPVKVNTGLSGPCKRGAMGFAAYHVFAVKREYGIKNDHEFVFPGKLIDPCKRIDVVVCIGKKNVGRKIVR